MRKKIVYFSMAFCLFYVEVIAYAHFSTVMHVQKHLKIRPTKAQIRLKHIVLDSRKTKIISSPYFR